MWPTVPFTELTAEVNQLLGRYRLPKRVDAILTADWHLRDSIPSCRTEGFLNSQWRNMTAVSVLQATYDCPVIHAGDLFHHWRSSPELIAMAMKMIPRQFVTIYGNHDLPYHSTSHKTKSALYVLEVGRFVKVVNGVLWDANSRKAIDPDIITLKGRRILIGHLTIRAPGYEQIWMDSDSVSVDELFDSYDFDLFLTGHLHIPFQIRRGDRVLLNPGPLTVQNSSQVRFVPTVYLWNAEENELTEIELPEPKDSFVLVESSQTRTTDTNLTDNLVQLLRDFQSLSDLDSSIDKMIHTAQEQYHLSPQVAELIYQLLREAQEAIDGN